MREQLISRTTTRLPPKSGHFFPSGEAKSPLFFQPKLSVGPVDDMYEREADAVAEKVMHMPDKNQVKTKISPITIQPKCSKCEEEEEKVQRKEKERSTANSEAPEIVDHALQTGGHSLDGGTKSFMENRFGYDFSQVKVHTGAVAAKSAQSINALAYTSGNSIVFNEGQYAPGTDSGKRLLAHELTHVVQQSGVHAKPIQRLGPGDPSFEISGLPAYTNQVPSFIYFGRNDFTIPASEISKISAFAAANVNQGVINLYGYSSEEGVAAENDLLISQRLNQVMTQLNISLTAANGGMPYTGVINTIPRRSASQGQIDYRMFRSVEMTAGVSAIGASSASVRTIDCTAGQHAVIDTTRDTSLTQLQGAITALQNYQNAPAAHAEVAVTLDNNFHSRSSPTVGTLLGHLRQMETDLAGLDGDRRRRCASPQYNACNNAGALTRRPTVTFCPAFFGPGGEQVDTLIHEIAHYARFDAHDRAYRFERVLPFLTTEEALDNSESIAIFILEINDPAGTRVESRLTEPASDTITSCGSNRRMVEEALGWAERWNTYAYFGMSQTYSNWDNFLFMAPFITRRFGPVNRFTLAGMFDRYSSLRRLFEDDLTLECPSGAAVACSQDIQFDPLTEVYTVCPSFFAQNLHNRIVLLYAEVTRNVPEIRDDQRRSYAELARDFKIHYWGIPPS